MSQQKQSNESKENSNAVVLGAGKRGNKQLRWSSSGNIIKTETWSSKCRAA